LTGVGTASRKKRRARQGTKPAAKNDQFNWDAFHPRAYRKHHYLTVRDDDRQIIVAVRDFFAANRPVPEARGLDVGPGANLYPSLAMLPFCTNLDLVEYSEANVRWLRSQRRLWRLFDRSWGPFWQLYGEHGGYREHTARHHPLREFRRKAQVTKGSIFDLQPATWDIGTMFFVACSMSADAKEFYRSVRSFLGALKPDAPFAAAFMTGSTGYEIAGTKFPAVSVDKAMIRKAMGSLAKDTEFVPIETQLRPGVGMMLVLGRANGPTTAR
jgi:hypothetical protein